MTLIQTFALASLAVGIAQIVDAVVLIRRGGKPSRPSFYFAFFEYSWAALCIFLLVSHDLGQARWLAAIFIVYIPLAVAVSIITAPKLLSEPVDSVRLPKISVYLGGIFGFAYAIMAAFVVEAP